MKQLRSRLRKHGRKMVYGLMALVCLGGLMLYKLGSLAGGLSINELATASAAVGWHGIYHQPLYLPLKLIRSIVFVLFPDHGQTLTRLPNVFFGCLAIISFSWLIRLWHSTRTALLAGLLFATSAWVLHVSRLASSDVLYLWATPTLLLSFILLHKYGSNSLVRYGTMLTWGLMLYIPGLVWLIVATALLERNLIANTWRRSKLFRQRFLYLLCGLVWLPLLAVDLTRHGQITAWLGLPAHLAGREALIKQFAAVPVHLFVRGPQYPDLWLARAPVLDAFTLVACLLGIYFYAAHRKAIRTQLLVLAALAGLVLAGLGGAVSLSIIIPLLYVCAATGIAYLLHQWLQVFPNNPFARGLGIGLICFVIGLSCLYNLRAYFVAWPHNQATRTAFQYHR